MKPLKEYKSIDIELEQNEYKQMIRQYSTSQLIEYASKKSFEVYDKGEMGAKSEKIKLLNKKTNRIEECNLLITQWELCELCFNSIKFSNDYFRKGKVTDFDFFKVYNQTKYIDEILEDASSLDENQLYKHLVCITNMEFDFEAPNIYSNFNRLYHMLIIINGNKKYQQNKQVCYIDIKEMFTKITSINIDKYIRSIIYLMLMELSNKSIDIMNMIDNINMDLNKLGFTKEDLRNIVKYLGRSYDFYKKEECKNWNILKYNPIVQEQKNENKFIVTNIVSLLISFSESIYWIVRNYYKDKNSQEFTNYFGHCFEFYLNDLFETYNINAHRIEESNDNRPDWKIETNNYILYFEQKSTQFQIDTRTITEKNRFNAIETFLNDTVLKAFNQLNKYDESNNKVKIRMLLCYEKINIPEEIQNMVISKLNVNDSEYLYWIISIDEFEKLMYILSEDEVKFNKIISKKIQLEKDKNINGRSFDKLLKNEKNDYIKNKINYFKQISDEEIRIIKEISKI